MQASPDRRWTDSCHCKTDLNALYMHYTEAWAPAEGDTQRGFWYVDFRDAYGQPCSLQESSVMPHLWLGVGSCRMHLSPEQVRGLIDAMQTWLGDDAVPPAGRAAADAAAAEGEG